MPYVAITAENDSCDFTLLAYQVSPGGLITDPPIDRVVLTSDLMSHGQPTFSSKKYILIPRAEYTLSNYLLRSQQIDKTGDIIEPQTDEKNCYSGADLTRLLWHTGQIYLLVFKPNVGNHALQTRLVDKYGIVSPSIIDQKNISPSIQAINLALKHAPSIVALISQGWCDWIQAQTWPINPSGSLGTANISSVTTPEIPGVTVAVDKVTSTIYAYALMRRRALVGTSDISFAQIGNKITRPAGGFLDLGASPGQGIWITNTAHNNGAKAIVSITDTEIVTSALLQNEPNTSAHAWRHSPSTINEAYLFALSILLDGTIAASCADKKQLPDASASGLSLKTIHPGIILLAYYTPSNETHLHTYSVSGAGVISPVPIDTLTLAASKDYIQGITKIASNKFALIRAPQGSGEASLATLQVDPDGQIGGSFIDEKTLTGFSYQEMFVTLLSFGGPPSYLPLVGIGT